jgi:hypothetical protein
MLRDAVCSPSHRIGDPVKRVAKASGQDSTLETVTGTLWVFVCCDACVCVCALAP